MKIEIVKECTTEDWKTNMVRPRPALKEGVVLEVEEMQNYYGTYYQGRYEGFHYYIDKRNAKLINV